MQAKRTFRIDEFRENISQETIDLLEQNYLKETEEDIFDTLSKIDLKRINDIATEEGQDSLIKACQQYKINSFDYLNMTPLNLATQLFITNIQAFISAENLYNVDSIDKFSEYKGEKIVETQHNSLQLMEAEIAKQLSSKGKGNKVQIQKYNEDNRVIYFVKYGDKLKDLSILDASDFKNVKMRLSKEMIMIHYPEKKLLKIKAPDKTTKSLLVNNFARYILKDEKYFLNAESIRYYDLKKVFYLKDFEQTLNPDEVESVKLKFLTLKHSSNERTKKTYESIDILEQIYQDDDAIESYEPIKVKLQFKLKCFGRSNTRTIEIATPNNTTLSDSPRDNLILGYLEKWGIAIID